MLIISKGSSSTINVLKCLLSIGVIMIHIRLSEIIIDGENILLNGDFDIFNSFYRLIMIFLRVCVPIYFMISGFLFFINVPEKPEFSFFKEGYKKRVRSLLIPYLIGNLFAIIFLFLGEKFLPGYVGGGRITEFSFSKILMSFWCIPGTNEPINLVLWFIRDLMVMSLLSPVFYWLIKKTNYWCLVLFFLNYIFEGTRQIPGFRPVAIFFFALGAYFSLKEKDIITVMSKMSKYKWYLLIAYVVFFMLAYFWGINSIKNMSVVIGVPTIMMMVSFMVRKTTLIIDKKWITATFFLYIYHNFPITLTKKLLILMVKPDSSIDGFLIFFGSAIIVILIMLPLYFLSRRIFPRTMAVVVGGR